MNNTRAFATRQIKLLLEVRRQLMDQPTLADWQMQEPRLIMTPLEQFLDMLLIARMALFVHYADKMHPDLPQIAQELLKEEVRTLTWRSPEEWMSALAQWRQGIARATHKDQTLERILGQEGLPVISAAALVFAGQLGILKAPLPEVIHKMENLFYRLARWWEFEWPGMQGSDEEWRIEEILGLLPYDYDALRGILLGK